jgi:hypothetical protein
LFLTFSIQSTENLKKALLNSWLYLAITDKIIEIITKYLNNEIAKDINKKDYFWTN